MTDAERREAERLATIVATKDVWSSQNMKPATHAGAAVDPDIFKGFVEGYAAACEYWRAGYNNLILENDKIKDELRAELEAERARSAKFIEDLKNTLKYGSNPEQALDRMLQVIDKFEASRD